jgi:hypothetical protein
MSSPHDVTQRSANQPGTDKSDQSHNRKHHEQGLLAWPSIHKANAERNSGRKTYRRSDTLKRQAILYESRKQTNRNRPKQQLRLSLTETRLHDRILIAFRPRSHDFDVRTHM